MSLTYVITGASRGLGLEFVKQISAKGHTVFALARNPDSSEGLKSLVDNKRVFAVKIDTTSEQSIKVKKINYTVLSNSNCLMYSILFYLPYLGCCQPS
jgi:short-subunit dehydrogenase